MEVSRTEIRPGVRLTHLREDKFKTAFFSIHLLTQLERETAAMNALIPEVLCRGSSVYPDMEALNARFDELYGTVIEPSVMRIGEIQCTGLCASFPEDDFLPGTDSILTDVLTLCIQILLSPVTRGGLLLPGYVESEREKLADRIASRVNNKRGYAITRCIEEMCCFENYAAGRLGDEESCRAVRYAPLTKHYRNLLRSCPIEITFCGRAPEQTLRRCLRDALSTLPRGDLDLEIGTDIRMNAVEEKPRFVEEEMDVSQANLVIGWRLGECMDEPELPAIYVFNELFGGSPSSRLFMNVREKLSLCYYASSLVDVYKGLLLVSSGIQIENFEKARDEIFHQLELLKAGDFTEDELQTARAGVVSSFRSVSDSQGALGGYWLSHTVSGDEIAPDEMAALVAEVGAERVKAVAASVCCDMIYLLKGKESSDGNETDDEA